MAQSYSLVDAETGEIIVPQLSITTTFWQRFRGLQFRRSLAAGEGLLIVPCRSIHTHWMRFSIDVAMIDRRGEVLALQHAVPPWRTLAGPKLTHAVLEVPARSLANRLFVGNRLMLAGIADSATDFISILPRLSDSEAAAFNK